MENGQKRQISDTENRLLGFHRRTSTEAGKKECDTTSLDAKLIDLTNDLSQVRSIQIRTLIDALVDSAFNQKAKLLGCEVREKFREHNIYELIADNFIDNLPDKEMDVDDPVDPAFHTEAAKEEVAAFIANYAQDPGKTLDSFIENWCRELYPDVNFYHLFRRNPELRQKLCEQMEMAANDIITQKYHILFKNNPRRFILDFIFGRALKIDETGKTELDGDSIKKLVEFMVSQKANPEDIYMILYEDLMDMSDIKENVLRTRTSVNGVIGRIVCDMDRYPFLHGDFNYDAFFSKNVAPVICQVRAASLPNKVRLTDITEVSPENMTTFLQPPEALFPLWEKVKQLESGPEEEMYQMRSYFNYECTPRANLADEDVREILGEQLQEVATQIEYTIKNALKVRADKEIREDCRFLPEILECRDVSKLFIWMAKPRAFYREPGNERHKGKVPPQVVAHQARKMLELLLLYRKFAFTEEYKMLSKNRIQLEEQFTKLLKIKNIRLVKKMFRVREIINDEQNDNGKYKVDFFEQGEDVPFGDTFRRVREDGKIVKYYPVEEKQFIECEAFVPGKTKGAGKWVTLVIYSGDGNIIHDKSKQSWFSSVLRGKVLSDGLRTLIVEVEDLREWLTDNFADNVVVVKDKKEGRNIRNKVPTGRKSSKSKKYTEESEYKKAMYITSPKKEDDGTVTHSHVAFEVQMDSLEDILLNTLSAYTRLSHETTYTPEREFDTLFRFLFPPILYGTKMADYYREGYDHNKSRIESVLPPSER
jgi:hypothetical protein